MSKKTGKSKRSKSTGQPIKAISSPIIFDSASVKSETIPIKARSKAKTNNRISEKDRAHSLSTFSTNSDAVSISSDSGISSSSSTISESEMLDTSSISSKSEISYNAVKDDTYQQQLQNSGQQKFAGIGRSGRKVLGQKMPKKVEVPTISKKPNNSTTFRKEFSQIESKPQQTQKKVEQTVSLDDRIKALQNRQNALQQKLTSLKKQSKAFTFIKSKEQKAKEKELNSQLEEVTKAKWRVELDRKFESDKDSKILDFVNKSRDASNSNNKHLEGIDKIVQEHFRQYGHYTCNNCNDFLNSRSFVYRSLQEILDRANPIYEDKQILLRYDAYQVKSLLQSGNIKEKEDKRALKEIYEDLKNEMSKSRKNFDSKDDQYICKLREGRNTSPDSTMKSVESASPDSIIKSVQTVQQSQHSKS
ncbi:MAG: hypothetical protein LBJ80_03445 [Rickettsiales bacterium]|jgi:hypothetical protein|nr:hypothetical protein [Rickettsiales bacterium]MDR1261448.1 hypothetical protein [Rickettsiales bacterium]